MTMKNLEKLIDPLFALSVFLLVVDIGTSIWNSRATGIPVEELLLGSSIASPLIVIIFILGMGTSNQVEKLKKRRQQSHT